MKILVIILIILSTSCLSRKDKNIINVNTIEEKIYIGMPKKELIERIGKPKDSILSDRLEKGNYYYNYYTNDLTGYTLTIWFNSDNKVSRYSID